MLDSWFKINLAHTDLSDVYIFMMMNFDNFAKVEIKLLAWSSGRIAVRKWYVTWVRTATSENNFSCSLKYYSDLMTCNDLLFHLSATCCVRFGVKCLFGNMFLESFSFLIFFWNTLGWPLFMVTNLSEIFSERMPLGFTYATLGLEFSRCLEFLKWLFASD